MRYIIGFLLCCLTISSFAQDTAWLKVHFLYGSKPHKQFKATEHKWFGGMLGGHVGIEGDSNLIVNFTPHGEFHWFAKKHNRHSRYVVHSYDGFYAIMGSGGDSVKKAIVYVPVTPQQKLQFDSLTRAYRNATPYDYALFGMRCGAAAYDILGHIGVLPAYGYGKTWKKIFYPKKLRKRLLKKANQQHWLVVREDGTYKRKWETD